MKQASTTGFKKKERKKASRHLNVELGTMKSAGDWYGNEVNVCRTPAAWWCMDRSKTGR